mmetsp:Transcript_15084/g.32963  ORF Transcript_15084/g.32963 Transcript_15084/m.32963 type:complete len:204 (-) Transcript_15084:1100-1711(-)
MQISQQVANPRVHDGFSNQTQRTVAYSVGFLPAIHTHAWNASGFFDHFYMRLHSLLNNVVRIIRFPFPGFSDGVLVMPPTKDALVSTRQGRRGFHALVRGDSIECVLVTASPTTQLMFCPTAQLHSGMSSNELVSFLFQCGRLTGSDHFSWFIPISGVCLLAGENGIAHILQINHFGLVVFRFIVAVVLGSSTVFLVRVSVRR